MSPGSLEGLLVPLALLLQFIVRSRYSRRGVGGHAVCSAGKANGRVVASGPLGPNPGAALGPLPPSQELTVSRGDYNEILSHDAAWLGGHATTKRGTRQFSSLGKKDFVSAAMYCYAAFLMWLASDAWRTSVAPEDASGFSGWSGSAGVNGLPEGQGRIRL